MRFSFHPDAREEFEGAVAYYEARAKGLGLDLALEVDAAIQRIVAFPDSWPVVQSDIRRCLVYRFPYGILYSIEPEEIFILAVMHLHRDPDYWKQRAQNALRRGQP